MFNALHPTASSQRFNISYEFFPPKTPEMEAQLWHHYWQASSPATHLYR
jgi:5,10-methylenetetrahydrofolate reductase